ncbi:rho gtpase-activating protein [Anaeramoeba flamelloides]|uniref:Rho gtpase-activating protein n=1 Tax=Anaeramoeba flamelloides TaxID=1746091 RepID=A0AAV7YQW8_9EUKA|nr:rho gtpase-activating protein [Anaeramoeba flamelloides]
MSKQQTKKLTGWKEKTKPALKRIRFLSEYMALIREEQVINFFRENYLEIYEVLSSAFHGIEGSRRKKKIKLPKSSDYVILFTTLEKLQLFSKDIIFSKWQNNSFAELFEFLCSLENKQSVRKRGFTQFLIFVDIIGENHDETILDLLKNIISFEPFLADYQLNSIRLTTKPLNISVKGANKKEATKNTKEERLHLFQDLLKFITEKTEKKTFWIKIFFKCFIPTLYPIIARQTNLITDDIPVGFRLHCPFEIQELLIEYLLIWIQDDDLRNLLFLNVNNRKILFEIFQQSFLLPISYDHVTNQVIEQYEVWIKVKRNVPDQIKSNLQHYFQRFITHILKGFHIKYEPKDEEFLVIRLKKFLEIVELFSKPSTYFLSQKTIYYLIESYINLILKLTENKENKIFEILSGNIIGTLFNIFISTRTSSRYHWNLLENLFLKLRNHFGSIIQWKRALIKLCVKFHNHLFYVPCQVLDNSITDELSKVTNDTPLYLDSLRRNQPSANIINDYIFIPKPNNKEREIPHCLKFEDDQEWRIPKAIFFWNKIFNLLGNISYIKDEKIHECVVATYIQVYNLLLKIQNMIESAKNKYGEEELQKEIHLKNTIELNGGEKAQQLLNGQLNKFSTYQTLPYFKIFCSIFFNTCLGDQKKHLLGRILSYGGICQLFCQRYPEQINEKYLSQFYFVLMKGLTLKNPLIMNSIIRYGSHLFGYCFPGQNGLLNTFVDALVFFLSSNNKREIPQLVLYHAITLLSSMICFQEQYQDLEMYNYATMNLIEGENLNEFTEIQELLKNELQRRENNVVEMKNLKEKILKEKKNQDLTKKIDLLKNESTKNNQLFQQLIKDKNKIEDFNKLFNVEEIKFRSKIVKSLSSFFLRNQSDTIINYQNQLIGIWTLCTCCIIELESEYEKDISIIYNSINTFITYCNSTNDQVSEAVNSALSSLSTYSKEINEFNSKVIPQLIKNQCEIILEFLNKMDSLVISPEKQKKEKKSIVEFPKYIIFILNNLLEWLISLPELLLNQEISSIFFDTLMNCLGINEIEKSTNKNQTSNETNDNDNDNIDTGNVGNDKKNDDINNKGNNNTVNNSNESENIKSDNQDIKDDKKRKKIKETKQILGRIKPKIKIGFSSSSHSNSNSNSNTFPNKNTQSSKKELTTTLFELILATKKEKLYNENKLNRPELDKNQQKNNSKVFHFSHQLVTTVEIVLLRLLISWGNNPLCEGIEWTSSHFLDDMIDIPHGYVVEVDSKSNENSVGKKEMQSNDDDDKIDIKTWYNYSKVFSYKEGTIISLHQLPIINKKTNDRKILTRLILRDITGKYVWDCEQLPNSLHILHQDEDADEIKKFLLQNNNEKEDEREKGNKYKENKIGNELEKKKEKEKKIRKSKQVPIYEKGNENDNTDMLGEMLNYISETIESEKDIELNKPQINLKNEDIYQQISQGYKNQKKKMESYLKKNLNQITTKEALDILPTGKKEINNYWLLPRLFLSQLGFFNHTSKDELIFLSRSDRLDRSLKELDKRNSREVQKIGVIYVAPKQNEQIEILSNEYGSPLYEEFVKGLGWEIEISNHLGYTGGLDKYGITDGSSCPYFANFQFEIIWHVVTRMPTSKNNPKQINKKRHVGNDWVHVVWSENEDQEYDPTTITSQFNFAHIVIYPLPNGLFRIQIFLKDGVQIFGPLIDGMIINKKSLPILVRKTAMFANKFTRSKQKSYQHPLPTRWDILIETIERYKETKNFKDYFSNILNY